jgi:DNA-binding transcriptional ArsR family regulator
MSALSDYSLLLSSPALLDTFKLVADLRKVRLKDLVERLQTSKAEASERLSKLKEAALITEESAPIDDFKIYYLTPGGLSAERNLRRMSK